MNTQDTSVEMKLSAIDKALAMAKARKSAKEEATVSETSTVKQKISTADRATLKANRDAERAARKLAIAQQREARKAARLATHGDGQTPHMKKIEKAAAALPKMSDATQLSFNEITSNLSAAQITALSLHLQHFNRVKATERALTQTLDVGQQVRIISGVQKYIGMTGTVDRAQRIRCFVTIPGVSKPVYLFTSDVELLEVHQASTGTEG